MIPIFFFIRIGWISFLFRVSEVMQIEIFESVPKAITFLLMYAVCLQLFEQYFLVFL
jgi:hypothetical protein